MADDATSLDGLVSFIAVNESTSGLIAANISTYVGRMAGGLPGALSAAFCNFLHSFLVIPSAAKSYESFKDSMIMQGFLTGMEPAVAGIVSGYLFSL